MTTKISIIICSANKPESLTQTLNSLASVHVPDNLCGEVIIVDNQPPSSSEVACSVILPNFDLKYLEERIPGKSNAMNSALRSASGDVVVCTDDDLRFPVDWVENLTDPIISGKADAVAGSIRIAPHLDRNWMKPIHRSFYAELLEPLSDPMRMFGANMAFHRRVLNDVPSFDPQLGPGALGFADDTLFSLQIAKAGHKIVFNPTATVEHHFDERRLLRESLKEHAIKQGRSLGYRYYHWEHRHISAIPVRILKNEARHLFRSVTDKNESLGPEGCSVEELNYLTKKGIYQQFVKESRSPPKY